MRGRNRAFWVCGVLGLGLVIGLLGGGSVSRAGSDSWTIETSPNPDEDNRLLGITAPSSSSVWAVGYQKGSSGYAKPLVVHWGGSSWANVTPIPTAQANDNILTGTTALSTSNIWAVGEATSSGGTQYQYAVHSTDSGSTWNNVSLGTTSHPAGLYGVDGIGASDVWAVGFDSASGLTVPRTQHWTGSSWTNVGVANMSNGTLTSVSAIAADDAWTVGYMLDNNGVSRIALAHWDGSNWGRYLTAINLTNSYGDEHLLGVHMVSASDGWAVG